MDIIKEINGEKASLELVNTTINSGEPGGKVALTVSHRDIVNRIEIPVGKRTSKSFDISPVQNPSPEQSAILDKWLK
jgi:hypothetical protein